MPAASFSRELQLAAPADSCWAALIDVPTLVSWISVLDEAHEIEPLQRYSAALMDKVGPFKLRADLGITLSDVQPGRQVRLRAAGEDRQVGSRVRVEAEVRLADRDGGTVLSCDGSYEVAGRVATLGAGTIRKKADKLMDEFFGNVQRALG
jgi:carbon monoxide dehydrogenase subunit G